MTCSDRRKSGIERSNGGASVAGPVAIVACVVTVLLTAWTTPAAAQIVDESPWSVYQHFQGASGDYGQILKLDTGVRYALTRRASIGVGLPYYFVRNTTDLNPTFNHGIGNVYVDLGYAVFESPVRYDTSLQFGAPTGSEDEGFSTGRVTVDWRNTFSVPLEGWAPFATVGLANTVADTSFFTRPFSSLGFVAHLQGGAQWSLAPGIALGVSGYAVVPSGDQTVVTRVRRGGTSSGQPGRPFDIETEVVGDADLARDHGASAWLGWYPTGTANLYGGFTRSVRYDLNSAFFGVRWSLGGL